MGEERREYAKRGVISRVFRRPRTEPDVDSGINTTVVASREVAVGDRRRTNSVKFDVALLELLLSNRRAR